MKRILSMLISVILLFSSIPCLAETCDDAAAAVSASENRYIFELAEGHQQYIDGETFDGDVIIRGDNAQITFVGCTFNGDIINTAEVYTRILIMGCEANGMCIFRNTTKEATIEASFPKFMMDAPVETACEDCAGAVIPLSDFDIVFNGETYTMADSELYFDSSNPEAGMVPYEGQEADYYCVAQWWENGELIRLVTCEK